MIRFGIAGTGRICAEFAQGFAIAKSAELSAVCSRKQSTADVFAKEYGASHSYASYESMAACDDIDIVYIGTPNGCHLDNVKMFLNSGKHVLCEKPMGVTAHETREMINTAKNKGLFLMEGMWTRCFPGIQKAVEWVKSGAIGDVKMMNVNMGINLPRSDWRFRNDMAGGAMLDVGIYAIAITFSMLGAGYTSLLGASDVQDGIDVTDTVTFIYPDGIMAVLNFGIGQILDNGVFVHGTKGQVRLGGDRWWEGRLVELTPSDGGLVRHKGEPIRFDRPYPSTGFQFEADHVARCIEAGLTESPLMTHEDSINIATTMDKLRTLYGVR